MSKESEAESVRRWRNTAAYIGKGNPLAKWMNSPEWIEAPRVTDSNGNRLARGHRVLGITRNELHGEIVCR